MSNNKEELYKKNLVKVKDNIKNAALKSGRNPDDILLVIAAKYADLEDMKILVKNGESIFGENRSMDLINKKDNIDSPVKWHFIGHLQSRKVKDIVSYVDYIHSVDSLKLIEKIDKEANKIKKTQKILIEVNISGEETKYGIRPEDLNNLLSESRHLKNVEIKGLMIMAPFTDDRARIREIFIKARKLLIKADSEFEDIRLSELSMGMSNDYEIAIEEGSTMVRVGSSIFK